MKNIQKLIAMAICILFYTNIFAQRDDILLTLDNISKTSIYGSCNYDPDVFEYQFVYQSPGFAPVRLISSTPNFIFPVNNTDEHSISVTTHKRSFGVVRIGGYKELIITVVTLYDIYLNTLNCKGLVGDEVLTTLPFEMQESNPDYDACAVCNFLNLASENTKTCIDEKTYITFNTDYINSICHHYEDDFRENAGTYDFCKENELNSVYASTNRLAKPNSIKTESANIIPQGAQVQLFNLQGAIVWSQTLQEDTKSNMLYSFNNEFNQTGVYLLHVTFNGKTLVHNKIIL